MGDLVFKTFEGREIVARMPDFGDRGFTDAQKVAQERFRKPTGYGKTVMADEQARKLYEHAAGA